MHKRLGDVLIDREIVTPHQILQAVEQQAKTNRPLGEVIVQLGLATEQQVAEALAEQQDVPTWNLEKKPPTPDSLALLPSEFCVKHQVLPVKLNGQILILAMQNSGNLAVIDEARKLTKLWVQAVQSAGQTDWRCDRQAFRPNR